MFPFVWLQVLTRVLQVPIPTMNPASDHVHVPVREKKTKLLHFSDGVEEVTDEDEVDGDEPEIEEPQSIIDEVSLSLQAHNPSQ